MSNKPSEAAIDALITLLQSVENNPNGNLVYWGGVNDQTWNFGYGNNLTSYAKNNNNDPSAAITFLTDSGVLNANNYAGSAGYVGPNGSNFQTLLGNLSSAITNALTHQLQPGGYTAAQQSADQTAISDDLTAIRNALGSNYSSDFVSVGDMAIRYYANNYLSQTITTAFQIYQQESGNQMPDLNSFSPNIQLALMDLAYGGYILVGPTLCGGNCSPPCYAAAVTALCAMISLIAWRADFLLSRPVAMTEAAAA